MSIVGLKDLSRKFGKLSDIGRGQVLFRAGVVGMLVIINEAKRLAAYKTGTLRRSLHVGGAAGETPDFQGGLDSGYSDLGQGEVGTKTAEVFGGTDVPYARRIELGFEDSDSLGRSFHQKARPFLRPAFDTKINEAIEAMRRAFVDLIERAVER
jgi:hypothetical protein